MTIDARVRDTTFLIEKACFGCCGAAEEKSTVSRPIVLGAF